MTTWNPDGMLQGGLANERPDLMIVKIAIVIAITVLLFAIIRRFEKR